MCGGRVSARARIFFFRSFHFITMILTGSYLWRPRSHFITGDYSLRLVCFFPPFKIPVTQKGADGVLQNRRTQTPHTEIANVLNCVYVYFPLLTTCPAVPSRSLSLPLPCSLFTLSHARARRDRELVNFDHWSLARLRTHSRSTTTTTTTSAIQ